MKRLMITLELALVLAIGLVVPASATLKQQCHVEVWQPGPSGSWYAEGYGGSCRVAVFLGEIAQRRPGYPRFVLHAYFVNR